MLNTINKYVTPVIKCAIQKQFPAYSLKTCKRSAYNASANSFFVFFRHISFNQTVTSPEQRTTHKKQTTNKNKNKQTDRWTDGQTDRQTHNIHAIVQQYNPALNHTHTHTHTHTRTHTHTHTHHTFRDFSVEKFCWSWSQSFVLHCF